MKKGETKKTAVRKILNSNNKSTAGERATSVVIDYEKVFRKITDVVIVHENGKIIDVNDVDCWCWLLMLSGLL